MTHPARKQNSKTVVATVRLARWQLREAWGLLVVTGVGIVAAVMLVCAVPLYANVAMSAGLRGVLTASPQNTVIVVRSNSLRVSAQYISKVGQHLDQELEKNLGPYLGSPQFSIETKPFLIPQNKAAGKGLHITNEIGLISASMDQAASHVKLLAGRLPRTSSGGLELAITQESAQALHKTVGSLLTVNVTFTDANQSIVTRSLALSVVGIFEMTRQDDPFWQGDDFSIYQPSDFVSVYRGLVSNETLLSVLTRTSDEAASRGQFYAPGPDIIWYYPFDPARIGISDLNTIIKGVETVKVDNGNNPDLNQAPLLESTLTYQQSDILEQYSSRTSLAQLPITGLLLLMLGLILFFVSMMADLLIDRQADAIAILHSRGASRRQIFGSLMTQSITLGLIAFIAGPLLALPMVRFIAQHALTTADQGALNLIPGNPLQGIVELSGFAILAVVATIIAMALALFQATRRDVLTVRREAARSTRQALWQRLNLDIVAALIALAGFGISVYFTSTGALDAELRLLLLSPLTLLESAFLLIASILIFLRFFPRILQLGTWVAMRARSATPMLALAQMARSPRQSVRMTLLLALTTAFAVFTLVFTASQSQRILDVAAYQGGADFSGTIPINIFTPSTLADATKSYSHIPGVTSVSFGYTTPATAGSASVGIPVNFAAVDANTFAQTATWTPQDSSQPLSSLMAELVAQRATLASRKAVPAIVDDAAWNSLHLAAGGNFALNFASGFYNDFVKFTAIARVHHIPTAGDSTIPGILTDYRSYISVYTKNYAGSYFIIPLNYVWLRTQSDPVSLTSVRKALNQGDLQLEPLYDRRAIIDTLYHEPLYLALTGVLALGATTAILLALVGNLVASWLSARSRLTNFAVLRAMGATTGQVASTLTWEQGIIYMTAIGLGIIFGAIFSALVIPGLVFTSVAPSGASSQISSGTFYGIQSVPPIQIVVPSSLGIALVLLVAICIIALAMVVRVVSRTSISQALRLNED